MLAELQKLQSSFPTHLHSPLPPHLQSSLGDLHTSLNDLSTSLGATINDLRTILVSDAPVGEKATKVGQEVQERISPLLERLAKMVGVVKNKGEEAAQNGVAKVNGDRGTQNGVAKANGDRGTQNGAAKSNGQPAQNGSSGTRRANGVNGHAEK
jgi:hypothetical protein